jgi:hypothetical protein
MKAFFLDRKNMLRMCIAVSGDEKNGTLKECSKEGIL